MFLNEELVNFGPIVREGNSVARLDGTSAIYLTSLAIERVDNDFNRYLDGRLQVQQHGQAERDNIKFTLRAGTFWPKGFFWDFIGAARTFYIVLAHLVELHDSSRQRVCEARVAHVQIDEKIALC